MWIEREIAPRLQRLAATRPVLVLTGARQTGKTSLTGVEALPLEDSASWLGLRPAAPRG